MRMLRNILFCVLALSAAPSLAAANDLLPATTPIEVVVDQYLDEQIKEAGVQPAAVADDAALLRRLTLDLVGRIPTAAEAKAYAEDTRSDKRIRLVDRLLASRGFGRHQANEFDAMLMAGTRGSVRDYLARAFAENRPWDQIYRDLLLADESDAGRKGCGEFLKQRVGDLDKLTADVSVVFFGVNVSCARCHDHPLVADWKQDHFYGMKSFFNRTFDNGGFVAEKETGVVRFKTVKGQEKQAKLMFLTGKVVENPTKELSKDEEKKERDRFEEAKKKKSPPPAPKFSARGQLVQLALEPDQRSFFARSIVNRVWARLFGLGLVNPVDQMHSENPASHPELLEWLARDTAEHGYDLRRLTRGLVLSQAYARSSRYEAPAPPRPQLFAVGRLRALTPMQLATSLRLAVSDPGQFAAPNKDDEIERRLEGLENGARDWARLFEQPGEDFQVGVSEALLMTNGGRVEQDLLSDGGDRLLARLKEMKSGPEVVEKVVQTVLSRRPSEDEKKLLGEYLAKRPDRPVQAERQLIWALLTSAEFRFNY